MKIVEKLLLFRFFQLSIATAMVCWYPVLVSRNLWNLSIYALGSNWYLRRYGRQMPTILSSALFVSLMLITACSVHALRLMGIFRWCPHCFNTA
ncbi:hypothetical protein SAMN05421747_11697 [Parapedobacter composti]|uniref:Uncharacterized protein n=1 Tax=Parapedobacter composti TaxID=623281 RepID=A0A1I1KXM9_9SPHI|nr:hypothetical protein SAMN05421747_11697 [Parapedobacter composti]